MATMPVRDSDGVTQTIEKPLAPGRAAASASRPVALSTEDLAALAAITAAVEAGLGADTDTVLAILQEVHGGEYEFVGASATTQVLGAVGGLGDYLERLVVIPLSTTPEAVSLFDDSTEMVVFYGSGDSPAEPLVDLKPFTIDLRMRSVEGAWSITTGANVAVLAVGKFTQA